MAKEVIMPALGMAQETGILLRWLAAEGDEVEQGKPIMEIATDKVDVEIEAPASGILANVSAAEGDEIPVGQAIAVILAPGEEAPSKPSPAPVRQEAAPVQDSPALPAPSDLQTASPVAQRIAAEHGVDLAAVPSRSGRIQKEDVLAFLTAQADGTDARLSPASPKARRLALEQGLNVATISGSGPDGAVLAADVMAVAERAAAVPAVSAVVEEVGEEIPTSRLWQVMARRLSQSWTDIPHFYLVRDVDAAGLVAWRTAVRARIDGVTYTDLLTLLVAGTLRDHPRLNAGFVDGKIVANSRFNIGLAVAVDDGLLVPVIHDADRLGLRGIVPRRAELVQRAQTGALSADDMLGGTFTVSNLGMYGIDAFNAIVNPPQAAILAVGRIADRVVPVGGQPAVRPQMTLTLSCDHRVTDGARAAQFLDDLAGRIEDPLRALE